MSIIDKITGRAKKAAGDLAGDSSLRREGAQRGEKGEAKEKLDDAQNRVEEKAAEVSDLERRPDRILESPAGRAPWRPSRGAPAGNLETPR